ncbi:MAG TPA: DNA topoisomerase I, partial [Rhodospirillaceae bacterium]|nr:DNA topoisomerase I [Rhodospirillaceae bacterium]
GSDPRVCGQCADGRMGLKLGKYGAFIGCSNYPTCKNTRPLAVSSGTKEQDDAQNMAPRELGADPKTKMPITVRVGPYGAYVQLDLEEAKPEETPAEPAAKGKKPAKKKKEVKAKPKRVSLPKGMDPNLINLETALKLLALPRDVGKHPETGEMITAGLGRFGAYIKMGPRYKSLADSDDLLSIGLNRAVVLLAEPDKGRKGGGSSSAKLLGEHPTDKKPVTLNAGRFGPYVKWAKVMATVTKAYDPENLTFEQALEIIEAKIAKGPSPAKGKAAKPAKEKAVKANPKDKGKPKPKAKAAAKKKPAMTTKAKKKQ